MKWLYLHGVGSPENEGVGADGNEEGTELLALDTGVGTTVDDQVPDNKDVGNAGNGVPSPLLGSFLRAESSEETGQDHDQVGNNGQEDVSTRHASQKAEIEDQQRGGDGPVDVTSPEDLAVDSLVCVGNVVILVTDGDLVVGDAVSGGHGEV